MAVLIKGMEMPKDCPMCPLSHWNKLDVLTGCEVKQRHVPDTDKAYWQSNTRPSWCPLVEVPEKRQFDRELLEDCGVEL